MTITTYDNDGNEIISRNYSWADYSSQIMASNLDVLVADSMDYLEEQALDHGEHEHADSVDADGTCLECGATNLI